MSHTSIVSIDRLVANPEQPRRYFDPAALDALAKSIAGKGGLQPRLVRPVGPEDQSPDLENCDFQIIAGERRLRAARAAGLSTVPVFLRACSDGEALQIGIIENDQREDLSPIEQARTFHRLMAEFGYTQHEIGAAVGRSRSYVANTLRLLRLPPSVQIHLVEGRISAGHGRVLVGAYDPAGLAEHIIQRGLSVRAAEKQIRRESRLRLSAARDAVCGTEDADGEGARAHVVQITAAEHKMRTTLGMAVDLRDYGHKGYVKIRYNGGRQYRELLRRLS